MRRTFKCSCTQTVLFVGCYTFQWFTIGICECAIYCRGRGEYGKKRVNVSTYSLVELNSHAAAIIVFSRHVGHIYVSK